LPPVGFQINEFPYPFKNVWMLFGYYSPKEAKRSLYTSCEKGVDFIRSKDAPKKPIFDQNGDDPNFLYLSKVGMRTFISCSPKPMDKHFSRIFFETDVELSKILQMVNNG